MGDINTNKLDNLYQLARRAKDDNNIDNAVKYYEQILLEDPNSWEAAFYSAFYSAVKQFKSGKTGSAIVSLQNFIDSVFDLITNNVSDTDSQKVATSEVTTNVVQFCEVIVDDFTTEFEKFNSAYMKTLFSSSDSETSKHNERVFDEKVAQKDNRKIGIAQVY